MVHHTTLGMRIIGSAEALPILCVRYFRWERERDTERERERDRDGSDVTIFALKLAMNLHFPCQKFAQLAMSLHFPLPKIRTFRFSLHTSRLSLHGEVTWRWNSQWVHTFHSQKLFRIWIYTSLAKNSHNWQWDYTFPCQKFALFVSPFTLPVSPFTERSRGAEIRNEFTLSIAKNCFALFVPPLSNGTSRATSDRKPKTNDQILASPILFFPSKNWIKLIPKTIGNRKRDCAWGGLGW